MMEESKHDSATYYFYVAWVVGTEIFKIGTSRNLESRRETVWNDLKPYVQYAICSSLSHSEDDVMDLKHLYQYVILEPCTDRVAAVRMESAFRSGLASQKLCTIRKDSGNGDWFSFKSIDLPIEKWWPYIARKREQIKNRKPIKKKPELYARWHKHTLITVGDVTQPTFEWSNQTGVHGPTIRSRLNRGWTPSQAVGLEPRQSRGKTEWEGKFYTITDLAKMHGLEPQTLRYRVKTGWPLDKALLSPPRPSDRSKKHNNPSLTEDTTP